MNFTISLTIVIVLVGATVLFHYEGLRLLSTNAWSARPNPRVQIQVTMLAIFMLHVFEIALWAVAYWLGDILWNVGSFGGGRTLAFQDYVYFSAETYTSLGFGDMYPLGDLRLLAGVQCLAGLLMLGWSASFTFLEMQRFWDRHGKTRGARH